MRHQDAGDLRVAEHRERLLAHSIAQALIEFETLTGDEIRGLMEGKTPMRPSDTDPPVKSTGVPSAGKSGKKRPDAEPGAAPEPQPGS